MNHLLICAGIALLGGVEAHAQTVVYKDLKTGDFGYCRSFWGEWIHMPRLSHV